jgi:hypothetical protein
MFHPANSVKVLQRPPTEAWLPHAAPNWLTLEVAYWEGVFLQLLCVLMPLPLYHGCERLFFSVNALNNFDCSCKR